MTDKTQPTAHAEITAPISADLRRIDDAGAQPVPAQQPKTLRELAEDVKDWATNQAWPHPDPDCDDIALFGYINEDGVDYPVAEVNVDTYGHEGLSLQLAQFYAAAHPSVPCICATCAAALLTWPMALARRQSCCSTAASD